MKVLLISYFFEPFSSVAVKRAHYWFNNFDKYGIDVNIVTATLQDKVNKRIKYVPLIKSKTPLSIAVKDPGIHWVRNLRQYFNAGDCQFDYDVVIVTGGPFMHFGIGNYLKQKFGCKTILDYRDPFAKNKRFNDSKLKLLTKSYYEKKFNKTANIILAVNEICKAGLSYKEKVFVVPNGFDDTSHELNSDNVVSVEKGLLINGGKLHPEFDETNLINAIVNNKSIRFEQVGRTYERLDKLNNDRIKTIGFVTYDMLVKKLRKAEITILMTAGELFETPTKVYDYIALNKKILIITDGDLMVGGIQNLVQNYPNVLWTKNNENDISDAINKLQSISIKAFDAHGYSRAKGLKILAELINNC